MLKKTKKNEERLRRHARVRRVVSGTPDCPRLSVFRSNQNIYCQVIDDTTGTTICSCNSKDMKLEHGGNVDAAKKVGAEIAKKCKDAKIEKVCFDRGGYVYHGRVQAVADGAREAGLKL